MKKRNRRNNEDYPNGDVDQRRRSQIYTLIAI